METLRAGPWSGRESKESWGELFVDVSGVCVCVCVCIGCVRFGQVLLDLNVVGDGVGVRAIAAAAPLLLCSPSAQCSRTVCRSAVKSRRGEEERGKVSASASPVVQ
jgi:hypothetical protein